MVKVMFLDDEKKRKKVVILNSRQPLGVSGGCEWVKKTIDAVRWVRDQGHVLITSVGNKNWEISLFSAIEHSVPVIILIPVSSEIMFDSLKIYYCTQFQIDPAITTFLPVAGSATEPDEQKMRDIVAVKMADQVIPVSVRKNGSMDRIVSSLEPSSCSIDFRTPYQSKGCILKTCYSGFKVNEEIKADWLSDYLFHWTRATWKPWPDELIADYYKAIVSSIDYPRTALKTLEHILDLSKIMGSDRHMPGQHRCVSFTGESPDRFLPLMRWRSRYREMSFESYGIGIRKNVALERGVKKVIYTESTAELNSAERWIVQTSGKKGNWPLENEYRCKDEFLLSGIDSDNIVIIAATSAEASMLSCKYRIDAIPMFSCELGQ